MRTHIRQVVEVIMALLHTYWGNKDLMVELREKVLPKMERIMAEARWELLREEDGIQLFFDMEHEAINISLRSQFGTFFPALITDGTNCILFWIEEYGDISAWTEPGTNGIFVGEDTIRESDLRQVMGVLLHEVGHIEAGHVRYKSSAAIILTGLTKELQGFVHIYRWKEFKADRYAGKNGYGEDLARWFADFHLDEDSVSPSPLRQLLRGGDVHPPTVYRIHLLTGGKGVRHTV